MTVSFAKGKKSETSISHNNRSIEKDFDFDKKGHRHIKQEFTHLNEVLVNENIRDVYELEFGQAVKDYNAKQKRKDRKIKDYYSKVKNAKNQRTQYEFIVQVGNKDNFQHYQDRENNDLWQDSKQILKQYFDGFQKRNPNLKVYNAAIHMDEEGAPHMHLNVVPVAHMPNAKRGLRVKPSFNQALAEEGFEIDKQDNRKQFKNFQHREASALAEIASRFGIERQKGIVNRLKDVHEYKQAQQIIASTKEQEREQSAVLGKLEQKVFDKQLELNRVSTKVDSQKLERDRLREENKRLREQQEFEKKQAQRQEELRRAVIEKQDKEIAEKKKMLEKLEQKLKATRDRVAEMAKHVATSLKEISSNASSAFMRKFGELEVTAKFERGQSFYDMEFTEFEDAGFTEDQEESFGTGADRANEKHKQQVQKNTQDTELVLKKPSRKELEEQYKRYLQSQDLNR